MQRPPASPAAAARSGTEPAARGEHDHQEAGERAVNTATQRVHRAYVALGIALLLAALLACSVGAVRVTTADWAALLVGEPTGGSHVLWELRLPRALLAATVGAALGLAGALTQGLFRNPMADPGLLGVTSGAVCAVALVLTVFAASAATVPAAWRIWVLPASAFSGALGVCFLLERGARWLTPGSITGLLLTGLALNAFTMAIVGLCTFIASDEQLRSLTFWSLGSLAGGSWPIAGVLVTVLLLALLQARRLSHALNALALGEAVAGHVGVDVQRLRARLIVVVALLSAFAVAWCGIIGFIGLMAPHLVRAVAGADQRAVLPLAMWAGAVLLLVADSVARTVAVPAEVPVGIVTALIGGPAFLLLLRGTVRQQVHGGLA
jgi:iron complex transport system permease protein